MPQAIKVTSRFATPYDTARVLGISKTRADKLIKRALKITDRLLHRDTVTSELRVERQSAAPLAKKNSGRSASTKVHKTKWKNRKARS